MEQQNITVAYFQQNCCFPATNVVFSFDFQFLHELMWIIIKINIWCRKTTFLLKICNNDALLLSASFISSGALHDDYTQNLVLEMKISENLDFWQFLKMEFKLHICCHDYDLSNITNWQHISEGPPGRNFCINFCFSTAL